MERPEENQSRFMRRSSIALWVSGESGVLTGAGLFATHRVGLGLIVCAVGQIVGLTGIVRESWGEASIRNPSFHEKVTHLRENIRTRYQ